MRKFKNLKLSIFIAAVFGLGLFFNTNFASADTFYVDDTNGLNSYDGTAPVHQADSVGPKKTITAGLALLGNDSDLEIRGGVYEESDLTLNSGVSGNNSNRIVISNYQNEKVYIIGGKTIPSSEWSLYNNGNVVDIYKDASGGTSYHRMYWAPKTGSLTDYEDVRMGYGREMVTALDEEGEYLIEYTNNGYAHYFAAANGKSPSDYILTGTHCTDNALGINQPIFDFAGEHDYITFDGLYFITATSIIRTDTSCDYITLQNITGKSILGSTCENPDQPRGIGLLGKHNTIDGGYFSELRGYFVELGQFGTVKNSYFDHMISAAILFGYDMLIDNCEFTKWSSKSFYSNTLTGDQNAVGATPGFKWGNVTIQNSYFHDTDDTAETQKWDNEVFGDDGGFAIEIAGKYSMQNDGFIQADGLYIRNNLFEDVLGTAVSLYGDGGLAEYKNVEISGNIFAQPEHNGYAEGQQSQNAITLNHIHSAGALFENVKIINNLFYGYEDSGIVVGINADLAGNWEWKNNIFLDNYYGYKIVNLQHIPTIETSNNIFFEENDNQVLAHSNVVRFTLNQWQSTFSGKESNSLQANPLLINPQNSQYLLQSNSPAIDAGTNVGLTKDYLKNLIPFDGNNNGTAEPDIGPYEYQGENNRADVNSDTRVNIKDIQICIKAITAPGSFTTPDQLNQLAKCKAVALPETVVNIKDIQKIVQVIIGG